MMLQKAPIKEETYSIKTLAAQTGLSLSTIYRRKRAGYTALEIMKEASIMKNHKSAGSNWKKVAKTPENDKKEKQAELSTITLDLTPEGLDSPKERKRITYWEPADDYGEIYRLKVLGGWIVKLENESLFVMDPRHKWEV